MAAGLTSHRDNLPGLCLGVSGHVFSRQVIAKGICWPGIKQVIAASWLKEAYPVQRRPYRAHGAGSWKSAKKHQVEGPSPNQAHGLQRVAMI